jgi:4-amino-4-deoxy-L-arabinose transferase-like glycosyltransferase
LFVLFLAFTLPGISWGAPSVWHPDEIVVRSINALRGEWRFSEINFDYPDLPQYTMFFLGKLVLALGGTEGDILVASRVLSALLTGLIVVLTYIIARRIGGSVTWVAALSGLLLICVSEMSHNGRFAHNDTYLTFFTTLSVLCLLNYHHNKNRFWLYASFLTVGMAASSKYIGGSLILAPLTVYLLEQRHNLKKQWFSIGETLFISAALAYLGFALGTPKALTWMAFLLQAPVLHPAVAGQLRPSRGQPARLPRSIRRHGGRIGAGAGRAVRHRTGLGGLEGHSVCSNQNVRSGTTDKIVRHPPAGNPRPRPAHDGISYNYQLRYFLTLMPFLAVLTAFFLEELHQRAKASGKAAYPSRRQSGRFAHRPVFLCPSVQPDAAGHERRPHPRLRVP